MSPSSPADGGTPQAAHEEGTLDPAKVLHSIQRNHVICLICGRRFRKLSGGHLTRIHNLSAAEYRARFGFRPTEGLTCTALKKVNAANVRRLRKKGVLRKANMTIGAKGRKFVYSMQELVERLERSRMRPGERSATDFQLELARRNGTITAEDSRTALLRELKRSRWDGTPAGLKRLGLHRAAKKGLFQRIGSLYAAYGAPSPTPHRSWTRESIAKGIRDRRKHGRPIHWAAVRQDAPLLAGAAAHHFGPKQAWNKALEYAGFRPEDVMVQRSVCRQRTRQDVLNWIRERARLGKPIHGLACIRDHEYGSYRDAVKLFGSIERTVQAAGLPPSVIGRKGTARRWDRQRIIWAVRQRRRKGLRLNYASVVRQDRRLMRAATRHFGPNGWKKAVRAASNRGS